MSLSLPLLRARATKRALGFALLPALAACHGAPPRPAPAPAPPPAPPLAAAPAVPDALARERAAWAYAGVDARGIPHYSTRVFNAEERRLLRTAYGVEDPNRLYLTDSSTTRVLKYDTRPKPCRTCYVNSYRIGFVSVRRPGESWDAAEERVRRARPRDFMSAASQQGASLAALDPDIEPLVTRFLDDARRAGFRLRVTATFRSPEREAMVMATGGGHTHTLTSLHSYGRALDVEVLDGRGRRIPPGAGWIAFRRWVVDYPGHAIRILGTPAQTWDWRHLELPGPEGFRSVDDALARARACAPGGLTPGDRMPGSPPADSASRRACDFPPHLRGTTSAAR